MTTPFNIAIVGTGPAGLVCALELLAKGYRVEIFEAHTGPGRKLLIAGRSGLNVSYDAGETNFADFYQAPKQIFETLFKNFDTKAWRDFIHNLGVQTFKGSSRRYFVEGLKAAPLLKAWIRALKSGGATFHYQHELTNFTVRGPNVVLQFANRDPVTCNAALLALGGVSWQNPKRPCVWPQWFQKKDIKINDFKPANSGFEVDWSPEFLREAEGLPFKNVLLKTSKQSFAGELTVTHYGLEGTPVYNLHKAQTVFLDLKPDLTVEQILKKFKNTKENLSPIRLAKKHLNLCAAVLALLHHHFCKDEKPNLETFCTKLKHFPIILKKQCGLEHAISASGGVAFSEVNTDLMLKRFPGIFVAGEMLDWSAPTGGFLIQAAASQGHWAAANMQKFLQTAKP